MKFSRESGFAHILTLLLILAGIIVGIFLVTHPTFFRPRASTETGFRVGVNIETAASYGYGDLRPYAKSGDLDTDLAAVRNMNGTIIRVFIGNNKISADEASKRLGALLDSAAAQNISVIPVFIDFYGSGHNPQGTDSFYTGNYNGIPLLNHSFFASGYKDSYKSFVQKVVSDNKSHSNIYAWEIGNELKDDSSGQTLIDFIKDISNSIKSIDSTHMVATGMISAADAGLTPNSLYPNLPDIDVITIHPYNGDRSQTVDVVWAQQNNKIAIVEEIGFSGASDRSDKYSQELNYWKSQGAQAVLPWGFIAKGLSDNGDGDRDVGFDSVFHSDYDHIFNILKLLGTGQTSISPTSVSCSQCILTQRTDILPFYKSSGWDTSSKNYDQIATNWCTKTSSQATSECNGVKKGSCNSTCGSLSDSVFEGPDPSLGAKGTSIAAVSSSTTAYTLTSPLQGTSIPSTATQPQAANLTLPVYTGNPYVTPNGNTYTDNSLAQTSPQSLPFKTQSSLSTPAVQPSPSESVQKSSLKNALERIDPFAFLRKETSSPTPSPSKDVFVYTPGPKSSDTSIVGRIQNTINNLDVKFLNGFSKLFSRFNH